MANVAKLFEQRPNEWGGCVVAEIAAVDIHTGEMRVLMPGKEEPVPAQVLAGAFGQNQPAAGDRVLVAVAQGETQPIVLGVIADSAADAVAPDTRQRPAPVAHVDGREVALRADNRITLECGQASITLTRDGKVTIRGAKVVSRASGVNKVKGGAIQLN